MDQETNLKTLFRHHTIPYSSQISPENIWWVPGILSPVVKWPGHEADYSPSSCAEVKNAENYTSTPSISLCGLVVH